MIFACPCHYTIDSKKDSVPLTDTCLKKTHNRIIFSHKENELCPMQESKWEVDCDGK